MRVLNDRKDEQEASGVEGFSVMFYTIMSAIAVATPAFAPLPLFAAHARLAEPWPKVVALGGALVALCFLGEPMPAVVIGFVFGLVASDFAARGSSLIQLFIAAIGSALLVGLMLLNFKAGQHQLTMAQEWQGVTDVLVGSYEKVRASITPTWKATQDYRGLVQSQGPIFLAGLFAFALWICVGFTAHFGWWKSPHPYSAENLRNLRLPMWLSLAFVGSLLWGAQATSLQFFLAVLMVMQGTILLSQWFSREKISPWRRALLYTFGVTVGLGVLAGLGTVAPLLYKNFKQEA